MSKIKKLTKFFSDLQNKKRYFLLNLALENKKIDSDKDLFEKSYTKFIDNLENLTIKNEVLLTLKSKSNLNNHFIIFKSENEVLPYDTIKKSCLEKEEFVKNFEIKEIELTENEQSKELIKVYSYLAAHNLN